MLNRKNTNYSNNDSVRNKEKLSIVNGLDIEAENTTDETANNSDQTKEQEAQFDREFEEYLAKEEKGNIVQLSDEKTYKRSYDFLNYFH